MKCNGVLQDTTWIYRAKQVYSYESFTSASMIMQITRFQSTALIYISLESEKAIRMLVKYFYSLVIIWII